MMASANVVEMKYIRYRRFTKTARMSDTYRIARNSSAARMQ
jgi:hypothetical protein